MNLIKKYFKSAMLAIVALMLIAFVVAPSAKAIPYGNDAPPTPTPTFNAYTGVPDVGNESDFFRVRVDGDSAEPVSDLSSSCELGKKFQYRVYVHNGASQYNNANGSGPSVAKDTKVKVALPGNEASSFTSTATISSSNAATVSDIATIQCNDGRLVKLSYVAGSAQQYNPGSGVQPLSDSIVTTGAPIGTMGPDGNMYGCWEQRVWVRLVVEVKEAPKPPVTPEYTCKATDVVVNDAKTRKITVTVNGTATNGATIVGYEINWGDGSKSDKQTDTHTYAKDGTYNIKGRVQVKLPTGEIVWVDSPNCNKTVKFDNGKSVTPVTPVTPEVPTTLPDTGAGDIISIFGATTAAGATAHHVFTRRKRGL